MRAYCILAVAMLVICGCQPQSKPPGRIYLEGTGFSVVAPGNFETRSGALYFPDFNASLTVAHSTKATFEEAAAEFNEEKLAAVNMKLISKEEVAVNGTRGILVESFTNRSGKEQYALTIAFPTETGVAQSSVVFPGEFREEASKVMREAMLSLKY